MADRYYSAEAIQGPTVTLVGSEAHHLVHVLRVKSGQQITLFDGRGGEFRAEVLRCGRTTVELGVGQRRHIERELPYDLTLAVALPKGDRQRWLVEKAVELGVTTFVPLETHYHVGGAASSKLSRYVVEASKQCGRNRLMKIRSAAQWLNYCEHETTPGRLLAHPGGQALAEIDFVSGADLSIAVGPEGGFSDEEIASAVKAGWSVVDLGTRILRVETAAVALVSAATMA